MIHGHTHRPGIHDTVVDGEPSQRIVLGAWYEQGSYLAYERGRYELRELARTASSEARLTLKPGLNPRSGNARATKQCKWHTPFRGAHPMPWGRSLACAAPVQRCSLVLS